MSARLVSPSVARNREPILAILAPLCESARRAHEGPEAPVRVLEVAAGSGEHSVYFASMLPFVAWLPSDRDAASLASIGAYRDEEGTPNLAAPVLLDATGDVDVPSASLDGVVCINMIHISPWEATTGLFAIAARVVRAGGFVMLYGPYREDGKHTAESNARFDAELRVRNPAWGVRDLGDVARVAEGAGFVLEARTRMPRDNLTVVFRKERA